MNLEGDTITARLQALAPEGIRDMIPPPCILDMQGELVEYVENVSLSVRFPVLSRYRNPLGNMQGGFIVAALDNTLGPLSFLVAPPSATSALNTQYLRPVGAQETLLICTARVLERTRNTLYLTAEARLADGKLVAICQSTNQILPSPAAKD